MQTVPDIRRLHLFEFEDLSWFPDVIRTGGTDYLRYFLIRTELYKPIIPLIYETMNATGHTHLIDLCSGGGGYIEQVAHELNQPGATAFTITLTDKFPNISAYELIKQRNPAIFNYSNRSVDVFDVPTDLRGIRMLFSAVHHFKPGQVRSILQNAVDANQPIAFFDGGEKGIIPILGLIIIHPVAFLLFTPFFKPFKLSRLIFTYLLPVIPLYTIWDGMVSILRMYRPSDLGQIAESIGADNYTWKYGKTKNRFGIKASFLIGYPKT